MLPAFVWVSLYNKLMWEQIQVQLPCSAQEGHRQATSFTDSAKAVPGNSYQWASSDRCCCGCVCKSVWVSRAVSTTEDCRPGRCRDSCTTAGVCVRLYLSVGPETENMRVFTFSVCFYTQCSSSYTNVTCCSYDLIRKADRCLGLHQCVHTITAVCVVVVEAKWQKWCHCSNT